MPAYYGLQTQRRVRQYRVSSLDFARLGGLVLYGGFSNAQGGLGCTGVSGIKIEMGTPELSERRNNLFARANSLFLLRAAFLARRAALFLAIL